MLLEAEALIWSGNHSDALSLLESYPESAGDEGTVKRLSMEGVALAHLQQRAAASEKLARADALCGNQVETSCGGLLEAHGILNAQTGNLDAARRSFLDAFAFAQSHGDRYLKANASLSLGWTALQTGHFDESIDWSSAALREAHTLGAEELAQVVSGNLGWAYYQLGDRQRALTLFLDARKSAINIGDQSTELEWISAAGYVYRDTGNLDRALQSYRQAYGLAKTLDSKDDVVNALEDLAQGSVDAGKLDNAAGYIGQAAPMELARGGHLSANVQLTQGMIAAARGQSQQAESLFLAVQHDSANPTTTRLGAGEQLARLYESENNLRAAEQAYKGTLNAFDSAQAELKSEESQLPFVANAARIYDGYIHLLLFEGRSDEALAVADQSRARTLAKSLDSAAGKSASGHSALNPRDIARKTGSTLLFYWLGQKQSCLWAVTPEKTAFFPLPAQSDISARIDRYRKALLDYEDPLESSNQDGQELYRMLVAPAAGLIRGNSPVVILADSELSRLNFETLLAPGAPTGAVSPRTPALHYWIDDVTVLSAPSLATLASARPASTAKRSLLLLGDPVSPSADFPSLPLFGFEAKKIQSHFDPHNTAAYTGSRATPAAYLSSNPARYSYIHFVSHAVSSSTDPLDSAIILSGSGGGQDSFKLYAREIMRRPIDAELVTISACYGSGTRSYTGEGLVGLSWAFLHAGAHSVIGALWEVSDDSTPRLMDKLYQGLEEGEPPAEALRKAKLDLLHSQSRFRVPFYWAPFQIYSSR
jgi:CHAT domain-containing protein